MGSRSAQACAFLSQQGYQVTNVLGGTSGWLGQLEQYKNVYPFTQDKRFY